MKYLFISKFPALFLYHSIIILINLLSFTIFILTFKFPDLYYLFWILVPNSDLLFVDLNIIGVGVGCGFCYGGMVVGVEYLGLKLGLELRLGLGTWGGI